MSEKEVVQARQGEKVARLTAAKAHTRDSLQALSKLGELVDGRYRIVTQPPLVVPALYELRAVHRQQLRARRKCPPLVAAAL